jgi:peptide/nickel transport system substrate-binding protein
MYPEYDDREVARSHLSRRSFLARGAGAGAGLLSLNALLAACGASDTGSSAEGGNSGRLIVGLNSDVTSLDPHRALGWTTMLVTLGMGEHLVTEDLRQTGEGPPKLVPRLAESYDVSPDGLAYTYHLRQNVKFHDGTPFDAAAVEFNIRRQWDKKFEYFFEAAAGISFWDYQFLKQIDTPDEHTVVLTLGQPWPEFVRMNAQSWGQQFMLSPTYVKKVGNEKVGDAPMLTGPYRFKERVPGERIVLVRNPDYWGEAPPMKEIVFRPMADVSTRVSDLTAGNIDIAQDPIPWSSRPTIEGAAAEITTASSPYLIFMSLNLRDKVMKNRGVRQAVEMGIDKENLVKALYGEWAKPAHSMLPANSPSYDAGFTGRGYDPEQAKALLADAGFGSGFETHMLINETYQDIATAIQRDLEKIGIKVVLDKVDFVTFGGSWGAGLKSPQTMTFAGWGMTADYWIDIMTRSTRQPPNGTNVAWYDNPDVDTLLDKAQVELEQSKRTELYRQVAQILSTDVPHVPLLNFGQPSAARTGVRGFVRPNEDWWDVTNVSV